MDSFDRVPAGGDRMTMTSMSRFQIHDEETAPERSATVLRGALSSGGELPHVLGVLAGAPAALRAYARFRSELRHGTLSSATQARIALAVAARHGSEPELAIHARAARAAGLSHDEVALAQRFESVEADEAALLHYLRAVLDGGRPPMHVHEAAREAGWSDESLIEAIAAASLAGFTATLTVAGEVPVDAPSPRASTGPAAGGARVGNAGAGADRPARLRAA